MDNTTAAIHTALSLKTATASEMLAAKPVLEALARKTYNRPVGRKNARHAEETANAAHQLLVHGIRSTDRCRLQGCQAPAR
jgi:hypothetical protein